MESGLFAKGLTALDVLFLHALKVLCGEPKFQKIESNKTSYTWVSYEAIMNSMPILGLTKRDSVYKRIKILRDFGLIEIEKEVSQRTGKNFMCLTEFGMLFYRDGKGSDQKDNPSDQSSEHTQISHLNEVGPVIRHNDYIKEDDYNNYDLKEKKEEKKEISRTSAPTSPSPYRAGCRVNAERFLGELTVVDEQTAEQMNLYFQYIKKRAHHMERNDDVFSKDLRIILPSISPNPVTLYAADNFTSWQQLNEIKEHMLELKKGSYPVFDDYYLHLQNIKSIKPTLAGFWRTVFDEESKYRLPNDSGDEMM